jgi:hypothetical protein
MTDFFSRINNMMLMTFQIGTIIITNSFKRIYEYLKNLNYNDVILNIIILYSRFIETVKKYWLEFYNFHPLITDFVDNVWYMIRFVMALMIDQRIEPIESNWISTSILLKRDISRFEGEPYTFVEKYDMMNMNIICDNDSYESFCINGFKDACDCAKSIAYNNKSIVESLITMKLNDKYIHYTFYKENDDNDPVTFPLIPCKTKFLTVEYTHPRMTYGIFLELDKNVFYANNEILSPLFILRSLKYQSTAFVFDMNYKIKILDENINSFELTSDQHIFLHKVSYKIVSNNSNNKTSTY